MARGAVGLEVDVAHLGWRRVADEAVADEGGELTVSNQLFGDQRIAKLDLCSMWSQRGAEWLQKKIFALQPL